MDDKLLNEIVQRLVAIETKLESIIGVRADVDELKKEVVQLQERDKRQEKDIEELRSNNKWLQRAIIGAVVTAAVGLVLCFIKAGMGLPQ